MRRVLWLFGLFILAPAAAEQGDQEYAAGPWHSSWAPANWQPADDREWYRNLDLVSFEVSPAGDHLAFRVITQGAPDDSGQAPSVDGHITAGFSYGGISYRLNLSLDAPAESSFYRDDGVSHRHLVDVDVSWQDGGWSWEIPRALVTNALDEPLPTQAILDGMHASAWAESSDASLDGPPPATASTTTCHSTPVGQDQTGVCLMRVRDRLPDEGFLPALDLDFAAQAKPLSVIVPQPIRGSNGEATTHVFPAFIQNGQDEAVVVGVESERVPEGWRVNHAGAVRIDPHGSAQIIVTADVPFRHEHGGEQTFTLRVSAGPYEGQVDMGVKFLEIPQPSGHHSRLFLHRHPDDASTGWMNTLERDDAGIAGLLAPPYEATSIGLERPLYSAYYWVPLQPELVLGIDAIVEEQGSFSFPFVSDLEGELTLSGTIDVRPGPDERETLFIFEQVVQASSGDVRMVVAPTEAADEWVVERPVEFALRLDVEGPMSPVDVARSHAEADWGTRIQTDGSSIDLPLLDFRSHVPAVQGADVLSLTPVSGAEFLVNSGGSRVASFEVQAPPEAKVVLRTEGSGASMARLEQGSLGGPWPASSRIQFTAPPDAVAGHRYDVVIVATTVEGPTMEAAVRFSFLVTEDPVASEEGFAVHKDSPLGLAALGGLLAAFLLRRSPPPL